jgi:hypothetical protein
MKVLCIQVPPHDVGPSHATSFQSCLECEALQTWQVKPRKRAQSIGCGKTFRGTSALRAFPAVHTWLLELGKELEERVAEDREEHARLPRLLTVVWPSYRQDGIFPLLSWCWGIFSERLSGSQGAHVPAPPAYYSAQLVPHWSGACCRACGAKAGRAHRAAACRAPARCTARKRLSWPPMPCSW